MATEMMKDTPVAAELPEILRIVAGELVVETDDPATARIAFAGFRYRLALEFARQQPALALLYEIEIEAGAMERGSIHIPFRIWIRLKRHVAAELKKAGAVAVIAAALALPGAIKDVREIYHDLFTTTQTQLQHDLPACKPVIAITEIRLADASDSFDKRSAQEFDLS